jgi:hypothetical protein
MILQGAEINALTTRMKQPWQIKWVEVHLDALDEVGPE